MSSLGRRLRRVGSGSSLRLAARVVWWFAVVELQLRRTDLDTTCARLGIDLGPSDDVPTAPGVVLVDRWRLARTTRAVHRVSARWPAGDTCLRRSLVLGRLLRDVGPRLVVGVRPATTATADGTSYDVHAWLEIGGHPLDPTAGDYVVLLAAGRDAA